MRRALPLAAMLALAFAQGAGGIGYWKGSADPVFSSATVTGDLSVLGDYYAASDIFLTSMPSGLIWSGGPSFSALADGQLVFMNNAGSLAVGLAVGPTTNTLRIRSGSHAAGGFLHARGGTFLQDALGSGFNPLTLTTTATNDDPMENFFQNRLTTTGATVTTIETIAIPLSTTVGVSCTVVSRRTGGAGGAAEDGAHYEIKVVLKNTAGTVAEIAAELLTVIGESQAGWTVSSAPSGGSVLIQVTGAASNDVTWHSHCRTWPVAS